MFVECKFVVFSSVKDLRVAKSFNTDPPLGLSSPDHFFSHGLFTFLCSRRRVGHLPEVGGVNVCDRPFPRLFTFLGLSSSHSSSTGDVSSRKVELFSVSLGLLVAHSGGSFSAPPSPLRRGRLSTSRLFLSPSNRHPHFCITK